MHVAAPPVNLILGYHSHHACWHMCQVIGRALDMLQLKASNALPLDDGFQRRVPLEQEKTSRTWLRSQLLLDLGQQIAGALVVLVFYRQAVILVVHRVGDVDFRLPDDVQLHRHTNESRSHHRMQAEVGHALDLSSADAPAAIAVDGTFGRHEVVYVPHTEMVCLY